MLVAIILAIDQAYPVVSLTVKKVIVNVDDNYFLWNQFSL